VYWDCCVCVGSNPNEIKLILHISYAIADAAFCAIIWTLVFVDEHDAVTSSTIRGVQLSLFSTSLSIRIASRALMLLNVHPSHLSVRTCEQWQNG